MKNKRTDEFRSRFARLPRDVQKQAIEAYHHFEANPYHPSLHFKCILPQEAMYSVRIGLRYRAVGIREGDTMYWFFIGSHEEYNHFF